ncbi:MAG: iron-containing alcohol dehydrogenase [Proteobacteria bacterium]|nr:iron-containing alcohol dehydrogenase [Pseudomonadota bacterium]
MYTILTPPQIEMGSGSLTSLKEIIASYGTGRVLIVTDKGICQAGILDQVIKATGKNINDFHIFDRVLPNPDISIMEACGQVVESDDYALIIGLGGGSPMDVAKAAAVLPANGSRIKPLLGRGMIQKPGVPLCLIPTTSGTGSETTQAIVVDDPESKTKKAIWDRHVIPQVVIVDPDLTIGMPASLTADTGLDALIHGIEAYTARSTNHVAQAYARECIELVTKHLPIAVKDGKDLKARSGMSLAATLGGLAISNGGLGAIHGLAYPLDTVKHIPHGRSVAIMAPWVVDFNRVGNEDTYAMIARFIGEDVDNLDSVAASQKAVKGIINLMESVGVSPYLAEHGIQSSEVDDLATEAFQVSQRLLPSNPRKITKDDAMSIYRAAATR